MDVDVKSKSLSPKTFQFQIGHKAGISDYKGGPSAGESWKQHWQVFPASLAQPGSGTEKTQIICPVCGKAIPFTVRSPGEAKKGRTKYLVGGLILLLAGIALAFSGWIRYPGPVRLATTEDFLRCVPVILGIAGIGLGGAAFNEFDLAISMDSDDPEYGGPYGAPRHKVFKPNERV